MKKYRLYDFKSPFLILGFLCVLSTVGAWGWSISQGFEGCAFCFWQRIALSAAGVSFIIHSQVPTQWRFSSILKGSLKGLSLLFCAGGIIVAWSHLTATFQSQVMGLARLMGTLSQAGEAQKPYLLDILKREMSLQWLLSAMPFWALFVFLGLVIFTFVLRESRS